MNLILIIFCVLDRAMDPGKQFTVADDKGPKDVIIYEKEGVFLTTAYPESA